MIQFLKSFPFSFLPFLEYHSFFHVFDKKFPFQDFELFFLCLRARLASMV